MLFCFADPSHVGLPTPRHHVSYCICMCMYAYAHRYIRVHGQTCGYTHTHVNTCTQLHIMMYNMYV